MNYGTEVIGIYIRFGDHPPPHIHVRRGGQESRVAIPTLKVLTGPPLSKTERELIIDKLDFLCDEYDRINPTRHSD